MSKVKKYFGESLLIVLSVLLALGVNSFAERLKLKKKKNIALKSIEQKINANHDIFKSWIISHKAMSNKLNLINTPTAWTVLKLNWCKAKSSIFLVFLTTLV